MHRIKLGNTVFEGRNNAYLFPEEPTTLVDTGVAVPEVRSELEEGLSDLGFSFADVDQMLLTHYHPDHSGLASAVQQDGGATVHIHESDASLIRQDERAWDVFDARQRWLYEKWGVPPGKREALIEHMDESDDLYGPPVSVEPFEDGDRFDAGSVELEAVHTPGHTEGHCVFVTRETGDVLTGDALLPHYTPNVGGADIRMDGALAKYLDTLGTIRDGGFDCAYPGHREQIDDPAARATEIIEHHEKRAWKVLDFLRRDGPADTWTVSDHLFGNLEGIHILHGPGEAHAHLEHMVQRGTVERTLDGYVPTEETVTRLDSIDGERWPLRPGSAERR